MGYDDETDRSRQKQGRGRQPVKRMGDRDIPSRKYREPGRSEAGLDLITDSFRDRGRRQSVSDMRGASRRRQAPADRTAGGFHIQAGPSVGTGSYLSEGPSIMSGGRSLSGGTPSGGGRSSEGGHSSEGPSIMSGRRSLSGASASGGGRSTEGPSIMSGHRSLSGTSALGGGRPSEGPSIMSGRQSLSGQQKTGKRDPGSSRRSPGNTSAGSAAARQTAASRPVSSERRAEESKTAKNRYQETYRQPENSGQRSKRSSIYTDPAKRKAKKKKRKIQIILLEAVLFLTVLVFAGYSYLNSRLGMIQRLPWDPDEIRNIDISEEKQEQMKGYWTIAIFGVDSRNSSVGKGNNSDVNILCNINQDTGEIKLVSVFRDSYLNVNDKNSYNKINAAYLQGGPEQAVKALNKNLDLDIDDYATFNWKAVADAINILGGIDVEITKAEFYYINAFISETVKATGIGSYQLKQAGMNHLDGVQAVAYGRLRLMDTDYARTERQRKVIALAFEKAKKADWATLNCIIQTVFPQVATSVDIGDLLTMGRSITKYHLTETMGFPAARGEKSIKGKGACVIPQTLESNVIELHKFLFGDENYQPTETVKTISRKISADSGLSTDAKPVGEVGTGGGSIPKTTAEAASEESTQEERSEEETEESGEAGESEGEGEAGELEGSEGNHVFPYGYPGYTTEQETDSGGNLILPSGGYEEEESTRGWWERPWGSQNETGERESITEGLFSGPSEAAGTGAVRPGSQTDTGVILAPGMTVPAD